LHVYGSADAPQWIYADAAGVLCAPLTHAAALLPADLHAVTINAEPAVAAQAQRFLPEGTGLSIVQTAQYLARALGSEWNLGQFDLATTGSSRQWQRLLRQMRQLAFAPQWRALRAGLLVLLLAQVLGLNVWAWKERQTLAGQRQQLRAAVSRITGATYISDTPVQQARVKVKTLQQATGTLAAGDFEPMLAVLAAGLPPMPAGSELHYEHSSLRLRAPALSAEALQQLRSAAAQAGYQVLTVGDSLEIHPATDAIEGAAAAPSAPAKPANADPAAVPAAVVSSLTLRTRVGRV
jgi:general secretion pathway protein L